MATPGTDDVGGPKASQISELRRTAKWHDPPEEVREEDDLLTGQELKLFQSAAARFNFLALDRLDVWNSVKELMRKMASPRTQTRELADIHGPNWTIIFEVFGDANFAGCHSTRKSTVGDVVMWSGQFVKAWSKTMGVLALSSGESELAAVVRAATQGMGLQSRLNDFCLCGHVAIRSDATDMCLLETCGCYTMFAQENSSFQNVRAGQSERCTNQVSQAGTTVAPHETFNWVPVVDDDKSC